MSQLLTQTRKTMATPDKLLVLTQISGYLEERVAPQGSSSSVVQ